MSKRINVKMIPVGEDGPMRPRRRLGRSGECAANLFLENDWNDSSLEIKWTAEARTFTVMFRGVGATDIPIERALSKTIPLEIAKASKCECGGALDLGDYRIVTNRNDFVFEGVYFCPKCKSRFTAERTGIRQLISKWLFGLKRIEIKAGGVGFERE